MSINHSRYAIDLYPDFSNIPQTATRNGYIIVTDGDKTVGGVKLTAVELVQKIKAANPACKVLVYKDLTGMTPWTNCGVPLTLNPPEAYYLHTLSGQRFTSKNYPQMYMANPAYLGYQQAWAANVVKYLTDNPVWDGVFMDDCNPSISYHHDPADVLELPGDAMYSSGVSQLLAAVTPQIRAIGKVAFGNVGAATDSKFASTVHTWIANYLDGLMWEWWSGNQAERDLASYTESQKKVLLARQSYDDTSLYGFCSLVMFAPHSAFGAQANYTQEPYWNSKYDIALGAALCPPTQTATGWSRAFNNADVYIDTTAHTGNIVPK